jgi:carbonic anhydrase
MAQLDNRPTTPADALAELLAGNQRFVTGTRVHPHQDAERRTALAAAQRPFAVLFGCSDSRLAAEIIFDRGLGDLFVVRTAGHVIGAEVLASIEYGVGVLGAPLVVVLGHDSCGAVQAAHAALTGGPEPGGHLRAVVDRLAPSILYAHARDITDRNGIGDVHVRRTVEMISADVAAAADGRCAVIGMSYRLAEGRVSVIASGPGGSAALAANPGTPAAALTPLLRTESA